MRGFQKQDARPARGIIQLCAGMLIIPFLDVFAKLLGQSCGVLEITFWRFFMQTILTLPFVIALRLWVIPTGTMLLQILRGFTLATATVLFFGALQYLPMAEAIAIFFAQPMILTILSAMLLGETIHIRRIVAILVGLVGTLIILQPTFILFGWPALLPIGSAVSMAFYMVITRHLSGGVDPFQMHFLGSLSSMVVLAGLTLLFTFFDLAGGGMTALSITQMSWVAGMGLAATIGHLFIVWAAGNAPASLLAPFQYVEIIGATALGFLIFSDVPADTTIIGVGIIIVSGVYLFHRERVHERRARHEIRAGAD